MGRRAEEELLPARGSMMTCSRKKTWEAEFMASCTMTRVLHHLVVTLLTSRPSRKLVRVMREMSDQDIWYPLLQQPREPSR